MSRCLCVLGKITLLPRGLMDSSDPLVVVKNSNFATMKEKTPSNQVAALKGSSVQRMLQVVQWVAQKSCRKACQLLCCPVDGLLADRLTCCPAQTEDKTTQVALQSPPSTILIVNISNSTLIDCVIGNDTYPGAVAESQPLMQAPKLHMHDPVRCGCSHGPQGAAEAPPATPPPPAPPFCPPRPAEEPTSINIHSSHLNCVIIGDNNYMHAEQSHSTAREEPRV